MPKEHQIFVDFLKTKDLKLTQQRDQILKVFLKTEKHLSAEDLYKIIEKENPTIGQATVFRTLKLFKEAGIAREIDLGDKRIRFEHGWGHKHHDHLICQSCSKLVEAVDPRIEELQNSLCKKFGFTARSHKLQIFGICKECRKKGVER